MREREIVRIEASVQKLREEIRDLAIRHGLVPVADAAGASFSSIRRLVKGQPVGTDSILEWSRNLIGSEIRERKPAGRPITAA